MNKYTLKVVLSLEASNPEAADDMVRDILEGQPDIIDFEVTDIASS